MVSTILILALVIITVVLVWSLLRSTDQSSKPWDCQGKRHEIDVQILRSLLDRNEFNYLHSSLSRKDFQNLTRKRIRLTLEILSLVEKNGHIRMQAEKLAVAKPNSDLDQHGDELLGSTVQLRLNLLLARICLCVQWLFPSSTLLLPGWIKPYQYLLSVLEQRGFQQL
jgi:hypothetical protein